MLDLFKERFVDYGLNENLAYYLSNIATVLTILVACVISNVITKKLTLRLLCFYISRSKAKWDDVFLKKKVFNRLAQIVPALIIHESAVFFPAYQAWIQRIAFSYIILIVLLTLNRIIDSIDYIYSQHDVSKTRPIKGYLQVLKIFLATVAVIIIISTLIDRSPWLLLSGLGAATAVLILIFQNTILGLVSGIQLATNNMIQIGDWIEMPSHGVDGNVIEITLHTVKVRNWDKTIVTIPPQVLISESFKNWKGMQEAGGRRIKRSIYLDMNSIKFCDGEMLERFKKIQYIKEYIEIKTKDIENYNREYNIDNASIVNGRHLTNIGTFRAYVQRYLKNHPRLNKNMSIMVRQLEPCEHGLPIEIYAFTDTTNWTEYETIQSDIFDHILAIVPEFDLKIYQNPSGSDIRALKSN
ncbi:MAG TPA: mechanosensitive ion channel family protein [Clostridiales bacterium]|nr:mechanosensitive ion channel family protein [Clostridiales bacterium]